MWRVTVAVGIDLVEVEEIRRALVSHGVRYLRRVYTGRERAAAAGRPHRLAAIFAAKEATLKALARPADAQVVWRDIEIQPGAAHLRGRLARANPAVVVTVSQRGDRRRALAVALVTREAFR